MSSVQTEHDKICLFRIYGLNHVFEDEFFVKKPTGIESKVRTIYHDNQFISVEKSSNIDSIVFWDKSNRDSGNKFKQWHDKLFSYRNVTFGCHVSEIKKNIEFVYLNKNHTINNSKKVSLFGCFISQVNLDNKGFSFNLKFDDLIITTRENNSTIFAI